jgi:hypothetical protein
MTITAPAPVAKASELAIARDPLGLRGIRWHRPLLVLAAAMVALAVFSAVAMFVDPREVTGLNVWVKPFKFAVSTLIYSVTLAWLVGQLVKLRRLGWWAGTVAATGLGIELIVITGFAAIAETSHFNVSTPLHAAAWSVMASSIVAVWVVTLLVAIALFRNRLGDPARALAIRSGAVLAALGMALAFLMTGPMGDQISNYQGIVGAHTVGVADGGPGLPLLGWSTVAGDLRIPHFVGMHGLQALPIFAIVLELLARRIPVLVDGVLRLRLVAIAAATYLAVVGLTAWQALIGQSIVQPGGPVLAAAVVLGVVAVGSAGLAIRTALRGRSAAAR